jgi:hypothetical protein
MHFAGLQGYPALLGVHQQRAGVVHPGSRPRSISPADPAASEGITRPPGFTPDLGPVV